MIEAGQAAPEFELGTDSSDTVSLASLRGKPVVLYFYPKDDTPGCAAQACGIRDAWGEFQRAGAVVLGVSADDEASHAKFRDKYELPFPLLADTDHAVAEAYGVWGEDVRRQDVHGNRPLHVRHRRRRHRREGDAEGQAGHARRRRARGARLVVVTTDV